MPIQIIGFKDYYDNILRDMLQDDFYYHLNRKNETSSFWNRSNSFPFDLKQKFQNFVKHENKNTKRYTYEKFILVFYGLAFPFQKISDKYNYVNQPQIERLEIFDEVINFVSNLKLANSYIYQISSTNGNRNGFYWIEPCLRDWKLQSIIDPFTAAYQVKQYLDRITFPEKEIQQISDEDMAKQKGFDHKYSFRREPKK